MQNYRLRKGNGGRFSGWAGEVKAKTNGQRQRTQIEWLEGDGGNPIEWLSCGKSGSRCSGCRRGVRAGLMARGGDGRAASESRFGGWPFHIVLALAILL